VCSGEISQVLETRVDLRRMPGPLPDSVALALKDPTAALAALMVIANAHRDLWAWASKAICGADAAPRRRSRKANGAGHRKPRSNGDDPYLSGRRAQRDRDDEALLAALRANPEGSIGDWATTIHKSRTSCVSALHRLRDAGLAESAEGKWKLIEELPPREPGSKWVAPLSAAARERRAHAVA
jgi:hypothetical protein